jgi:uncharacterized protein YcbK (DUF882 family)|tara:strand:- start:2255 stop:2632 length:378 start_codon:yes stop_codon:yes gene_type:complete
MPFANFTMTEFACPCCDSNMQMPSFIERLQLLRTSYGKSITVNSGYRCEVHNREVGGVANSAHLQGHAVDFTVPGGDVYQIIKLAYRDGFTGIGVRAHGDRRMVHLDDLLYGEWAHRRPYFWTYE